MLRQQLEALYPQDSSLSIRTANISDVHAFACMLMNIDRRR